MFSYAAALATLVLPAILLCVLYGRVAKRVYLSNKWAHVSCVLLAVQAGLCHFHVDPPDNVFGADNVFGMEFGLHSIVQVSQFLIPLAIGWWFLRRKDGEVRLQMAS